MTNMMLRMFVSGVDSLASDTLGTTFWYVGLNAWWGMPLIH